jgi:lysine-specific demethylase 8
MSIARILRPTAAQVDRCIAEHRPVIFQGLMEDQPASQRWDLPYLRTRLGDRPVQVVRAGRPRLHWHPQAGLPLEARPFTAFADAVFERHDEPFSYLQDDINSVPSLRDDYRLPAMLESRRIRRAKLWLSGAGPITPLHYDPVETFHWMIRGTKRFRVYRPGVRAFYPFSWKSTAPFISQVDPDEPDLQRHPRFAGTEAVDFELRASEVLYLPIFWWHQVTSLAALNLSLNFVWFASLGKTARHLPQFARAARHLTVQYRKARARAAQSARQALEAHAARP